MAAEIAPRKINGSIGSRVRVILGQTGNDWLLVLDKDNGDSQRQEIDWNNIPFNLALQLNNCTRKGRKITSVDFRDHKIAYGLREKTPWYIEGVKDGVQTRRWWGDTDASASMKDYKHSRNKVQVSFGGANDTTERFIILEEDNGYCLSPYLPSRLQNILRKSQKEGAKIHFIRLFSRNQYFVSTNKSDYWNLNSDHLQKEIKKGNAGNICDVAVANNGSWIVVRSDYVVCSTRVDNQLTTKLHRFYTKQQKYNKKRSQEITEFHNRKEREAREERERKERERAERVAREQAERERVEREAREAAERAQREALEAAVSKRVSSLEAKIEEKLLEEVKDIQETEKRLKKHIQETEKRLKKRKRSVLDVMQEMSPARRSRISIGMEETNDTKSICVICQDRSAQRAVVPCGHLCLCDSCSAANMELCPLCRGRVGSTIKIYMGN